ncbi:MAG: anti-sigma factor family protein [Actinomycetota bacterium]
MRCEEIQEMLPSYAKGEGSLLVRRHLARCTDCRAELEQYEELTSSLTSLRGVHAEPPRDLLPALMAIPAGGNKVEQVRSHLTRNRKVYAGGLAVALVGAAGAALVKSRSRRLVAA